MKGDECLGGSLAFVILEYLKEHEDIEQNRLEALRKEIESDGLLKKAIAADEKTGSSLTVILGFMHLCYLAAVGYRSTSSITHLLRFTSRHGGLGKS